MADNQHHYQEKFWTALEDLFVGARVEGKSGFINLMQAKSEYFRAVRETLRAEIDRRLEPFPEFREELYTRLYDFFHRYFTESGSIYFAYTPLRYRIYQRVYPSGQSAPPEVVTYDHDFQRIISDKEDVTLFWKTRPLYYVKTDRLVRSMTVQVGAVRFFFDASEVALKKGNEKKQFVFEPAGVREDGTVALRVIYTERGRKTRPADILKQLKESGVRVSEKELQKAFRTFRRQADVDYFINKDAGRFLREQFDLWMYQYLFSREERWSAGRFAQLQALKQIAGRLIDFIARFEDELRKIWEKPRLVFDSHYVISADRIARQPGGPEILQKLARHPGFAEQAAEWRALKIVDADFDQTRWLAADGNGDELPADRYRFLPLDTRYFADLEPEILALFPRLDEALDGWLIHSENWQALNSLLPRFRRAVQTIYIDPPFNLGGDADFFYNVNYKDATWLTLLENRVSLAREFLRETGAMFVRCDYNGNSYVKELLGHLFGKENFLNEILINRKRQSIGTPNKFEVESEYLYLFARSAQFRKKDLYRPRGLTAMKWTGFLKQEVRHPRERAFFGKVLTPPDGQHFSLVQPKVDKLLRERYLRLKCAECGARYYWDDRERGEEFLPEVIRDSRERFKFMDVGVSDRVFGVRRLTTCRVCGGDRWKVEYLTASEQKITDNWKDIPSYEDSFGFRTQNSERLLKRVIAASSEPGDLVMDFFLGSGTTTAVAHKMGRRWLGIELGEHFNSVVLPRMKKVLAYDKSGISRDPDVKAAYHSRSAGGFFKYYRMEQYEDILRTVAYRDRPRPEADGADGDPFLGDRKLLKAVALDRDRGELTVDFRRIYPRERVDLAESIANSAGVPVRRLAADTVTFADGSTVDLRHPDIKFLKSLLWWE